MTTLFGHDAQIATFLDALRSGRMHHAWLLAGPAGVGKARFARAAALRMLAEAAGPDPGGDGLHIPPDHRIAKLFEADSHPDFRELVQLPFDSKGHVIPVDKRSDDTPVARSIRIDQVRALLGTLTMSPALSAKRAILVDPVDVLERNAANALLKSLEEPPAGTVFLLVSHSPANLLPTIRSRCRTLRFKPLSDVDMAAALRGALPGTNDRELDDLVAAGEGAPGLALARRGLGVPALDAELDRLVREGDRTNALRSALSGKLAAKAASERYHLFLERAPRRIATEARARRGRARVEALELWDRASTLSAKARPLSLDPATVTFCLAGYLAALAPAR